MPVVSVPGSCVPIDAVLSSYVPIVAADKGKNVVVAVSVPDGVCSDDGSSDNDSDVVHSP